MKKIVFLTAILAVYLVACNDNNDMQSDKVVKVSLRQEWFPTANYVGELFAQYETGKKYGLDIKLDAGSDNIDPIKLVLSGENDFGIASADRILTANETGANLVVIAVANPNSPTCFLSKADKNIKTPKNFEGHTVGILTGTNTELIYKILKKKAGLDDKKIKEVEIPFDLATFIANQYDVRPAFVYDEPVSLDQQGIKYDLIKPVDYGVNFLGTVYFTKASTIKEKPEIVQAFVNALADGWNEAFKSPEQSIKYLKQYDKGIDEKREALSLQKAIPYFTGDNGKTLTCDYGKWIEMVKSLKDIGALKNATDISQTIDTTFIHNYYQKEK